MLYAKRIFLGVLLPLVVLIGGVAVHVATLDLNAYRADIAAEVEDFTGRKFTISGPISGNFLTRRPTLILRDVALDNAKWGIKRPMAFAKRAKVEFAFLPMLKGSLKIKRLLIYDADIVLETSRQGVGNWEFENTDGNRKPVGSRARWIDRLDLPFVRDVRLIRSLVTYRDGLARARTKFRIQNVVAQTRSFAEPIHLTLSGTHNGVPIKTVGTAGSVGDFLDGARRYPLKMKIAYAGSDLDANLVLDLSDAVTRITGSIASSRLDIDRLRGHGLDRHLSNVRLLPLGLLKAVDADLKFQTRTLVIGKQNLRRARGTISVKNGELRIAPFAAQVAGGTVKGNVTVDGTGPKAVVSLRMVGRNFSMYPFTRIWFRKSIMAARMTLYVNLAGTGASVRTITESLSGQIVALVRRGPVKTGLLGLPSKGLVAAINPWSGRKGALSLNCIVSRFDFVDGIGRSRVLVIDSPRASLTGRGKIDLRKDTINLVLTPRTKIAGPASVGALMPIRVRGPIDRPKIYGETRRIPGEAAKSFFDLVSKPFKFVQALFQPEAKVRSVRRGRPCPAARAKALGQAPRKDTRKKRSRIHLKKRRATLHRTSHKPISVFD